MAKKATTKKPDPAAKADWVDPEVMAPDDVDQAIERARELKKQIAAAENELKSLKDENAVAEEVILNYLNSENMDSIKRQNSTFFRKRDMNVASVDGTDKIVERCLKNKDLQMLLGINHPKLKSFIKEALSNEAGEWEADEKLIPKELKGVVRVEEFYKLGHRSS